MGSRPRRPRQLSAGRRPAAPAKPAVAPGKRDRGLGGEQVEGRQAVRELLVAGRRKVREVLIASGQDDSPVLEDIADLAARARVPVRTVGKQALAAAARTEAPQGVVARAGPLAEADLDGLAQSRGGVRPFLLAVDGVTDPGNLGALLRSAEGTGVTGVVLPRHRSAHITPAVTKAAAGAIEYLPMAVVPGLPAALARLQTLGVWVVGLDPGGERPIDDLALAPEAVALVVGSEGKGLSRLTRQRCDLLATIPLRGRLASLNVAAAGAIACYEIARQRRG